MKISKLLYKWIFIGTLAALMLLALPAAASRSAKNGEAERGSASLLSSETVRIVRDGSCEYTLVFSSDSNQLDAEMASELRSRLYSLGATSVTSKPDTAAQTEKEILLGNTNRPLSALLLTEIEKYESRCGEALLVWGFMEKDGKLAYTANSETAFDYGRSDVEMFIADGEFSVEKDALIIRSISVAEYEKELAEREQAERDRIISELVAQKEDFTLGQFGGEPKEMGDSPFASPAAYPQKGDHPRLLITEGRLDELRDFIYDPEHTVLRDTLFGMADSDECINGFASNYKNGVLFRYSETLLAAIEAKALAYLITGDEIYGLEAIISAKNVLLTLVYPKELHMDTYHGASHTMTTVALVYDWCYDLLDSDDKAQIIGGVSNLMCPQLEYDLFLDIKPEIGAVSGHGTGPQFLRDYITVALAFFDEMPDWWEYVGGKFYEDYVPVIDVCYEGGWGSQGSSGYGTSKYYLYTWAAYTIESSTGEIPYKNADGARLSAHFWLSHLTGERTYFQTGDSTANANGVPAEWFYLFPAAALYADSELAYYAHHFTDGYSEYFYNFSHAMTPALMSVFASRFPDFSAETDENYATVRYFSSPAGQMTARSEWGSDGAVALMKIGEMTMGNHDNYDHGTFQIYYKGLLATSSGSYDKYASDSHRYYRQSTVAHNGLLIFNPSMSDSEPMMNGTTVTNASRYYYSGSQARREEAPDIEAWLSGSYELGEVTGADFGYSLTDGSAKYAYLAGDITKAYDSLTVNYVARRMLTVFTSDPDIPMLFFTFDSIDSVDGDFRKIFLLHTVNEPEIDSSALTATVTAGDGKLVLHSVSGAEKLIKVGGTGRAYWISNADYENPDGTPSGKNCTDSYTTSDRSDVIWGRLELSAIGEKRTDMLTAMYVSDKTCEKTLPVSRISSETVEGAAVGDVFAVFVKSEVRAFRTVDFLTEGDGLYEYYVSGIETGTWYVSVDGVRVANLSVGEDSGFASFVAPAGMVTLTPGKDVIGSMGGRIVYETGGARLPEDAPTVYGSDEELSLPDGLIRGEDIFIGWYTTPTFEDGTRVTKTPLGATGTFKVYARWLSTLFSLDYSDTSVNISETHGSVGGVSYNAKTKVGASFVTGRDESGGYLTWTVGENDPHFSYTNYAKNISTSSADDKCITFTVALAPSGDSPIPNSDLRIISKTDVNGGEISSKRIGIFRISEGDGSIYLGDSNTRIAQMKDGEITTLTLVLDFKNGRLLYYDSNKDLSAFTAFTVPNGVGTSSTEEWMKCFDSYVFYWYGNSNLDGAAMRIYSIKVEEGDRISAAAAASNKITYVTGGGTLPEDAPRSYLEDAPTPLPIPTRDSSRFYGWYTDESYSEESRVSEVPKGTEGAYTVYAKWGEIYVNASYSEGSLNVTDSNKWLDGITYKAKDNEGASFVTKLDGDGKAYLEWTKGKTDPFIHAQNETVNFSASKDSVFSYTLSLRAVEGRSLIGTNLRIISKVDTAGNAQNASLTVLNTDTEGSVTLGTGTKTIATLGSGSVTTLRIALDFGEGRLKAYSPDGTVIAEESFSAPTNTGAEDPLEWQKLFTSYLLYWYGGIGEDESALAIYGITVSEGNIFE